MPAPVTFSHKSHILLCGWNLTPFQLSNLTSFGWKIPNASLLSAWDWEPTTPAKKRGSEGHRWDTPVGNSVSTIHLSFLSYLVSLERELFMRLLHLLPSLMFGLLCSHHMCFNAWSVVDLWPQTGTSEPGQCPSLPSILKSGRINKIMEIVKPPTHHVKRKH